MAQRKPNPQTYESHYPSFRQVEWNPDPPDIGAIIDGAIGQTIARNAFFDKVNQLWRLGAGDAGGRMLTSSAISGAFAQRLTQAVVTAALTQILGANPSRQMLIIQNIADHEITLQFGDGSVATAWFMLANDFTLIVNGYTGSLSAQTSGANTATLNFGEY